MEIAGALFIADNYGSNPILEPILIISIANAISFSPTSSLGTSCKEHYVWRMIL